MRASKSTAILSACLLAQAVPAGAEMRETGYLRPPVRPAVVSGRDQDGAKRLLAAAGASSLPQRWDSRDCGWVTPVRNQNPFGTCWTFAACATIETQLLKAGRGTWDFSEKNLANLHGFEVGYNVGGNNDMAAAYFLRWGGAVAESNDVYKTSAASWSSSPSRQLDPAMHVQNVVWIPTRTGVADNDALKAAITNYGAVSVSYCHDDAYMAGKGAYYCYGLTNTTRACYANHAVTAIGWDDSYPASSFNPAHPPPGDGAWLIKNSWGSYYGDGGYIHISYYDMTFMAGCDDGAVFVPATEEEDYTAVYGYDRLGVIDVLEVGTSGSSRGNNLQGAVFTSAYNEEVAAVGVYSSLSQNSYVLSIYTNVVRGASSPTSGGVLACEQSGTLSRPGYTTIRLAAPVRLADRTNFAVVYRQTGSRASFCLNYSCDDGNGGPYAECDHEKGCTYIGRKGMSSTTWNDAATYYSDVTACVCLKAYTRSTKMSSDGPGETSDCAALLADLAATNQSAYAQFSATAGAFANLVGANGRSLWASWLAGFDPSDADSNRLVAGISVADGEPRLSWTPDLGSARKYTVFGANGLSPSDEWRQVDESSPGATGARFFKVSVEPR